MRLSQEVETYKAHVVNTQTTFQCKVSEQDYIQLQNNYLKLNKQLVSK